MRNLIAVLMIFGGAYACATGGAVRKVRFEDRIDQTQKQAGCFAWEPARGELTLLTPETCALMFPEVRR